MQGSPRTPDFSLVAGGPLHRLLTAARLTGSTIGAAVRGGLVLAAVAWLPLLIGATTQGTAVQRETFLHDLGLHARLLLSLPLMLVAEPAIGRRFGRAVRYLGSAGLIDDSNRRRACAAIDVAHRMRRSVGVEGALVILAVASPWIELLWLPDPEPWVYAGSRLSFAGVWYSLVSVSVYRFLLLRWVWRLVVWVTFLVLLARSPLKLKPAHPDRLGGLCVVSAAHQSFGWLVFAMSLAVVGALTERVQFGGAAVLHYRYEVVTVAFLLPALFLSPTLAFSWPLERLRRRMLEEYGSTAASYGARFRERWLLPASAPVPLDTPDTSAHTDMTTFRPLGRGSANTLPRPRRRVLVRVRCRAAGPVLDAGHSADPDPEEPEGNHRLTAREDGLTPSSRGSCPPHSPRRCS